MKKRSFSVRTIAQHDCWGRWEDSTYVIEDNEDEVYFSTGCKKHAESLCDLLNKTRIKSWE